MNCEEHEADLMKRARANVAARRAAALEEEIQTEAQALRNRAALTTVAGKIHERDLRQQQERDSEEMN
jgi:hypothetical protein